MITQVHRLVNHQTRHLGTVPRQTARVKRICDLEPRPMQPPKFNLRYLSEHAPFNVGCKTLSGQDTILVSWPWLIKGRATSQYLKLDSRITMCHYISSLS